MTITPRPMEQILDTDCYGKTFRRDGKWFGGVANAHTPSHPPYGNKGIHCVDCFEQLWIIVESKAWAAKRRVHVIEEDPA